MDQCIRNGVTSTETHLPGGLNVKRRAPHLYRRLQKGFYPTIEVGNYSQREGEAQAGEMMSSPTGLVAKNGVKKRIGKRDHELAVVPRRNTPVFPGIEYLSCMAIAVSLPLLNARYGVTVLTGQVNEVNASGGRVVTAPWVLLSSPTSRLGGADRQHERCSWGHSCDIEIRHRIHLSGSRTRVSQRPKWTSAFV